MKTPKKQCPEDGSYLKKSGRRMVCKYCPYYESISTKIETAFSVDSISCARKRTVALSNTTTIYSNSNPRIKK